VYNGVSAQRDTDRWLIIGRSFHSVLSANLTA
jgi:hypothetical protein